MKKWTRLGASMLTLTLCLMFGVLLLSCMRPVEDRAYDPVSYTHLTLPTILLV